jgi:hypothetical protein
MSASERTTKTFLSFPLPSGGILNITGNIDGLNLDDFGDLMDVLDIFRRSLRRMVKERYHSADVPMDRYE